MKKVIRTILLAVAFITSSALALVEEESPVEFTIIDEDGDYEGGYKGVSKVYETIDLFFFQSFFDTLSQ